MPTSIESYGQAVQAAPPPKRNEAESIKDRDDQSSEIEKIKSEAGDGKGLKIDFSA